jgi:hypothetical protein
MPLVLAGTEEGLFIARPADKSELQVLLIPPKLLYKISQLLFGPNASFPEVALGYDPNERMCDPNQRIMCIPSSYVTLPKFIHERILAEKVGMYLHDGYHLLVDGAITYRDVWTDLAEKFQEGDVGKALNNREHTMYVQSFWSFKGVLGRPVEKEEKDDIRFWMVLANILNEENSAPVLSYIMNQEKEWGPKYNISLASLRRSCERHPDNNPLKALFQDAQKIATAKI